MSDNLSVLYRQLGNYLKRFLKQPEDIEDVVQDAFLKSIEAAAKGEVRYPSAYLYTAARNLAINKLTRNYTELYDFIEYFPSDMTALYSSALEEDMVVLERYSRFCRVVSQLPKQCRKVIVLRKVYGYSQNEVAEMLGISVSTVEKHLVKGMVRCTEYMARQDATYDIEAQEWSEK